MNLETLIAKQRTLGRTIEVIEDLIDAKQNKAIIVTTPKGDIELPLPPNFHAWLAEHRSYLVDEYRRNDAKLTAIDAILNA